MDRVLLTLCLIYQHPKVLLGMKKHGFGEGRWNGFGGKLNEDETIEEAAIRQVREEAGIDVQDLFEKGVLEFEFQDSHELLEVHVFECKNFSGEPIETDEMRPDWFHVDHIPYEDMWPDDQYWMPLFLAGKKFKGKFSFNKEGEILTKQVSEAKEEKK